MNKLEIAAVKFKNALDRAFPNTKTEFFTSAIVAAAGSGTRMGGVSKQLVTLCGKPCIWYSLHAFQKSPSVGEIIVTARPDEIGVIEEICRKGGITKFKAAVAGSNTRQESIRNAFLKVDPKAGFVAVHDAARPLILPEDIEKLILAARRTGSAIAAKKMSDTVKRADSKGLITQTVPRFDLYRAQTPQVFKTDIYRVSLALAEKDCFTATDDASMAEHAGFPVALIDLGHRNIKMTVPGDDTLLEKLLKEEKS